MKSHEVKSVANNRKGAEDITRPQDEAEAVLFELHLALGTCVKGLFVKGLTIEEVGSRLNRMRNRLEDYSAGMSEASSDFLKLRYRLRKEHDQREGDRLIEEFARLYDAD